MRVNIFEAQKYMLFKDIITFKVQ